MCKRPYLAVPQLCRELLQPLKVFVFISSSEFLSILGNIPSRSARGKALPTLILPYFSRSVPQDLGTHRVTFFWGDNVKLLQGSHILSISPWSVTGMLWSPNIVIMPVLSHPSITSLLSGRGPSIKMFLFWAEQAPGRQRVEVPHGSPSFLPLYHKQAGAALCDCLLHGDSAALGAGTSPAASSRNSNSVGNYSPNLETSRKNWPQREGRGPKLWRSQASPRTSSNCWVLILLELCVKHEQSPLGLLMEQGRLLSLWGNLPSWKRGSGEGWGHPNQPQEGLWWDKSK